MFTKEQIKRYERQLIMPEIGGKGQKKLFDAKVLVVGAGGLGSAVIQYLAAAGVGTLGIVDGDVVEESNLQRQTIHAGNIGKNKAESAKEFVEKLNPDVNVKAYPFKITVDNVKIINKYDVIIDCSDNFPTKYLLNDVCVLEKKPLVHSAVLRFVGEIMTINNSACYRCVFIEAPPPGTVPSCQEAGIAGVTTGLFGVLQATEAIKLILSYQTLENKMLYVDLITMDFDVLSIAKNPECPVCNGKVKKLVEDFYVERCKIK